MSVDTLELRVRKAEVVVRSMDVVPVDTTCHLTLATTQDAAAVTLVVERLSEPGLNSEVWPVKLTSTKRAVSHMIPPLCPSPKASDRRP